jgi:S-adenosylmethionine:tRNA ribosyltransferase-isomerase
MLTTEFDYNLPEEAIAIRPPKMRGQARLLVVDKQQRSLSHHKYSDIIDFLKPGDALVLNVTKVFKARLLWPVIKNGIEKTVETLFLGYEPNSEGQWEVKTKGLKFKGDRVLSSADGNYELLLNKQSDGRVLAKFLKGNATQAFQSLGNVPIPPYLHRAADSDDELRYNPEFAKNVGSVAAPTASLNMTNELLARIQAKGIKILEVTLHVSWGTFAPVQSEKMENHQIHSEYYEVSAEVRRELREIRSAGGRIWALGTTAARVLETIGVETQPNSGWTDIFIYPSYNWKLVTGLITNFHVPQSSLLALVSAFADRELILHAYQEALAKGYKFLSYGDSMLIF